MGTRIQIGCSLTNPADGTAESAANSGITGSRVTASGTTRIWRTAAAWRANTGIAIHTGGGTDALRTVAFTANNVASLEGVLTTPTAAVTTTFGVFRSGANTAVIRFEWTSTGALQYRDTAGTVRAIAAAGVIPAGVRAVFQAWGRVATSTTGEVHVVVSDLTGAVLVAYDFMTANFGTNAFGLFDFDQGGTVSDYAWSEIQYEDGLADFIPPWSPGTAATGSTATTSTATAAGTLTAAAMGASASTSTATGDGSLTASAAGIVAATSTAAGSGALTAPAVGSTSSTSTAAGSGLQAAVGSGSTAQGHAETASGVLAATGAASAAASSTVSATGVLAAVATGSLAQGHAETATGSSLFNAGALSVSSVTVTGSGSAGGTTQGSGQAASTTSTSATGALRATAIGSSVSTSSVAGTGVVTFTGTSSLTQGMQVDTASIFTAQGTGTVAFGQVVSGQEPMPLRNGRVTAALAARRRQAAASQRRRSATIAPRRWRSELR